MDDDRLNIGPVYNKIEYRNLNDFGQRGEMLGKGSYGKVIKYCRKIGECFAIKEIGTFADDNLSSSIKEISLMSKINHPNIVELLDVVNFNPNSISHSDGVEFKIVMNMYPYTLQSIKHKISEYASTEYIMSIWYQLCKGLNYLHAHHIWHRDIKPHNILIANDGRAVIADLGLARFGAFPINQMTNPVVTYLYRAPELYLGLQSYGPSVDIYALGLTFIEMLTGNYYLATNAKDMPSEKNFIERGVEKIVGMFYGDFSFESDSPDQGMMRNIVEKFGGMTEESWPGISLLPLYKDMEKIISIPWKGTIVEDLHKYKDKIGSDGIDLLIGMTRVNPSRRLNIYQIIQHPYFSENIKKPFDLWVLPYSEPLCSKNIIQDTRPVADYVVTDIYYERFDYSNMIRLSTWLYNVTFKSFKNNVKVYSYGVKICLLYLNKYKPAPDITPLNNKTLQLIGAASHYISSLIFEIYQSSIEDYVYIAGDAYTYKEFVKCVYSIIKVLKFQFVFTDGLDLIASYGRGLEHNNKTAKHIYMLISMLPKLFSIYHDSLLAKFCLFMSMDGYKPRGSCRYFIKYRPQYLAINNVLLNSLNNKYVKQAFEGTDVNIKYLGQIFKNFPKIKDRNTPKHKAFHSNYNIYTNDSVINMMATKKVIVAHSDNKLSRREFAELLALFVLDKAAAFSNLYKNASWVKKFSQYFKLLNVDGIYFAPSVIPNRLGFSFGFTEGEIVVKFKFNIVPWTIYTKFQLFINYLHGSNNQSPSITISNNTHISLPRMTTTY